MASMEDLVDAAVAKALDTRVDEILECMQQIQDAASQKPSGLSPIQGGLRAVAGDTLRLEKEPLSVSTVVKSTAVKF